MLGLKGQAWEYRSVNLIEGQQERPEYAALNPIRQVPVLELTEEDGRVVRLAQSLAIAEYLEERWPKPPLLPADRVDRARVRQVAETVNSGIQPLGNTSVRNYVRDVMGADDATWCQHWLTRGLGALEAMVAPTAGIFAFGDTPTLADVCIVPQLFHARRFGVDVAPFSTLLRIDYACASIEAFANAHALRQPDAPQSA